MTSNYLIEQKKSCLYYLTYLHMVDFLCILASLGPYYMKIMRLKLCTLIFCPKGKKLFSKKNCRLNMKMHRITNDTSFYWFLRHFKKV